jgi:hypothetical protein
MIPSLELPFEFGVDTEKVLAAALVYIDANSS